ncbi:phage/plasmid primase, P4 family [Symmachiella dynata]|uniref:phage/plasmid primase, P4 family n=1 Tax=Symmachiella dynata TaxID=2527995 RepID=UPI0030EE85DB
MIVQTMDRVERNGVAASSGVDAVLEKLDNVKQTASGWSARCPAHVDETNSLSIDRGDSGRVLVHCFAGCQLNDILEAVGLTQRDLFQDAGRPRNGNGKHGQIVATYDYVDADGDLQYQACRLDPKAFRQRQPNGNGGWKWSMEGVDRIPYRLPQLLASELSATIFIPEGEKDVDRLQALGLVATCNVGGAQKWKESYSKFFERRRVAILPDNDAPGRAHADDVARKLHAAAASVKVVTLPGLTAKGDVSNWLDAGGTVDELRRLVSETVEWKSADAAIGNDEVIPVMSETDLGNARRLVAQHGDELRYCFPSESWLIWDGRRWKPDDRGEIYQRAKQTITKMFSDSFGNETLSKHAARSQSVSRIEAMTKLARDEVPILPMELDRGTMQLNVANGTIDLNSGRIHAHDPTNHITKLCPTIFNPEEKSESWLTFLNDIFAGDQELIGWLQRWFGYCLTGKTTEHLLPVFWGTGANGKSTLLEAILYVMGDEYAMQAPPDFLIQKRGETHPTERADLMGRRFVACTETGDGCRLAEPLVKSLTGGDKIRARFMRQDFFQFDPTHKLVLVTNHKPLIRGTDHGIWRRLRLVPFNITVPEERQDKNLPAKLREESPAILSWLIEGCLAWQHDGLTSPGTITDATESYRLGEDIVGQFIADRCVTGAAFKCRASHLFAAYKKWSEDVGEHPVSQRRFGDAMGEKMFAKSKSNGVWYESIGVKE